MTGLILNAGGGIARAIAEEPSTEALTNAFPLVTHVIQEEVRGLPRIARAYLNIGTNKFAFLIPPGFRLDPLSDEQINIVAMDRSSFISVRRLDPTNSPTGTSQLLTDSKPFRNLLLEEYPGARFRGEFPRSAAGRTGRTFDFDWNISGGGVQAGRAAFIPTDAGILEFKLVTSPKNFRAATYRLNILLLSFCSSKDGKLNVVRLSNKL